LLSPSDQWPTERINQEVKQYLRIFINKRHTDWSDWLPSASFLLQQQNSFFDGLFTVLHQPQNAPLQGTNPRTEYKSQSAKDFVDEIKKVHQEAESSLKQATEMMKRFYNCKKSNAENTKSETRSG